MTRVTSISSKLPTYQLMPRFQINRRPIGIAHSYTYITTVTHLGYQIILDIFHAVRLPNNAIASSFTRLVGCTDVPSLWCNNSSIVRVRSRERNARFWLTCYTPKGSPSPPSSSPENMEANCHPAEVLSPKAI